MSTELIVVLGLGISGYEIAKLFNRNNIPVFVSEKNDSNILQARRRDLEALGISVEIGHHDLAKLKEAKGIVLSPGIPNEAEPVKFALSNNIPLVSEIEAATRSVRARGNRASAFRLKKDTADYENLSEQFSVPTVLAMVKGCGHSAVSERITEASLLEALDTASTTPPACCPPGTDPSQCDPSNSQR